MLQSEQKQVLDLYATSLVTAQVRVCHQFRKGTHLANILNNLHATHCIRMLI